MGSTKIQTRNYNNKALSVKESMESPHSYTISLKDYLSSMENSFTDFLSFNSQLKQLCQILSLPLRSLLSVIVISRLLVSKFPNFPNVKEIRTNFLKIKDLILASDMKNFTEVHAETLDLVGIVRDFIQRTIGEKLSPGCVLTILTCAELFKRIQFIPLELVISAANNCFLQGLEGNNSLPSVFSLFNSQTAPFLPRYLHKEFTLVLDLDETLGHFSNGTFLLRPGVQNFIQVMSLHFELVLFTAASMDYADWAMQTVDPFGLVMLRLYRHHTSDNFVKDLNLLGRDLNKTVIIDNFSKSFEKQPDNGIEITSWIGDENDTRLIDMIEPLCSLLGSRGKSLKQNLINLKLS